MKKLNLNKGFAIFGFIGLMIFVYFRENLLLEINAVLAQKEVNTAYAFWFADFFIGLPKEQLIKWKWIVSISFTFSIAVLTIFSLHNWFRDVMYTKRIVNLYLFLTVFLILMGLVSYLLNSFNDIYPFLRRVFGVIHSPIPFFMLFLLIYWKKKQSEN